ncbi:YqaJ viral recombinase family protein [Lysobacter koreensis]|uniref:YqaJ viral recombinase family protein n=1 Tax=Lysobacter koreensis TaxID=266122 RepID=A0ABW2YIN1_9GAMM
MSAPVYHPEIEQGTDDWHAIRAGKWTASSGAKIMGGLDTQGLKDLVKDLAWGRVFGKTDRGYSGKSMERGHELEPEAREAFAFEHDATVEQVGFVEHGRIAYLGWSPDGLHAQRKRGLEIKCLEHKAFIDFFECRQVPSEYRWQVKIACMVGALDGLDFYVYHPLAGGITVPVEITDAEKDQIEGRISILEPRVQALVDRLMERKAAA